MVRVQHRFSVVALPADRVDPVESLDADCPKFEQQARPFQLGAVHEHPELVTVEEPKEPLKKVDQQKAGHS